MKIDVIGEAKKVIEQEADALFDIKDNLSDDFPDVVNCIKNCSGKVIFTGVGKSAHIAKKISATMSSLGIASFFINSCEAAHGDLGCVENGDVVFIMTNSGETQEIINILPYLRKRNVQIILMTGRKDSTVGQFADYIIDYSIKGEADHLNLAPTTSTTAMLALGDALAVVVSELKGFKDEDFYLNHPGGALGKQAVLKEMIL